MKEQRDEVDEGDKEGENILNVEGRERQRSTLDNKNKQ